MGLAATKLKKQQGFTDIIHTDIIHHERIDFFLAVSAGNIPEIEACIETNPWIVNYTDSHTDPYNNYQGWTAIHHAAANNRPDIAEIILNAQKSLYPQAHPNAINAKNETPLHIAASLGHMDMVTWLLNNGAHACINAVNKNGKTALHLAIINKHDNVVVLLKKAPSTPPSSSSFFEENTAKIFSLIEQGKESETLELLKRQPHQALEVDESNGWTVLHYAVGYSQLKLIVKLMELLAENVNTQDNQGRTPLHLAVLQKDINLVQPLLASDDKDINIQDYNGRTPLHLAIIQNDPELVKLLIASGDVNLTTPIKIDDTELTILQFAKLIVRDATMITLLADAFAQAEAEKPSRLPTLTIQRNTNK